MKVMNQYEGKNAMLYCGDSIEVMKGIPDNSVGYSIFSPPFADLYTYSNSERDMGNCSDYDEFWEQFKFIVKELNRILKPGRSVSFHCMNIPAMKERDGYIGVKDFRGDLIRLFQDYGFIYHSEAVIWKDPLIEATRTKALGLMHKQLMKDSYISRQGLPDYLITMRKKGFNSDEDMITHERGIEVYYGSEPPKSEGIKQSHLYWQKYASPVWMDIRQGNTLNRTAARSEEDEKHICPLQLDTIARGIELWSNPNDIVFTPFMGIGSEVYQSLKMGRKAIGIELKEAYYEQATKNIIRIESELSQSALF
jgi:DNA modification methylase